MESRQLEMKTEAFLAERKRTEQALSESEDRFRRLLKATTDYIYSVELHDGQAGSTTHGLGCESVTGYAAHEFSEDPYLWYRVIYEEDRPAVMNQVQRILHDETPPPLEHRIVRRDGRIRWIRNTPIPHHDAQGRLVGYDGLITDVTSRKLAEIALKESRERLALVIRGSTDGIWDWNVLTGEVYFGPRWKSMLGYEDDELENKFSTWERLLHPDDYDKALAKVKACLADPSSTYELEARLRHKDGSYRWILARAVVLRDAQGKPLRMAGSHVDLTERKQAEEKLQVANAKLARNGEVLKKMVRELHKKHRELRETQQRLVQTAKLELTGTLAAGVAHEVKNPLQTIIMGLHLLSRKLSTQTSDSDVILAISEMREAVLRAKAIIGDLLTLSTPMEFSKQLADLNRVIERSLGLLKNQLVNAKVTVVRQLAAELPQVAIDPVRIEQVFLNLLLNSIQAMPKGGTITVTTRAMQIDGDGPPRGALLRNFKTGDRVVKAEFRDTGCGIKEEHLPRIFDPFFTTKPPGVGIGLGLSMAKKIVDHHNGAIEFQNSPTGGVVATVLLKV